MRAVITVIGKDRVGILADLASVCAKNQANVVDVSQTIMQEYFTMTMLVEIDQINLEFEEFQQAVKDSNPDMTIHVMHEEIFNHMHRV
ncbi:hypothetical protein AWM75_05585 [Aerococcus urinaehominis]|uniref:Uncharacterized protein n=1 Tax=Aerococcus urinaehominis TaxID=128944 RepID=A0A0X8FLF9_9LACT|nr:ACT domain-containing protein [Aerococcus urinaehominis]AMB99498.1 hypothetical protein AWM75_05585 [Aerococcus urinaehominis]SDM26353.1 ACT domain-containing protein [Aerococcus urinaehominis]